MNDAVFLSNILLMCFRAIGLGVAYEFYHDTKDLKFRSLLIGWSLWILGTTFPIYLYFYENSNLSELLYVLNAVFISLGGIFIVKGIFSYFLDIPIKFYLFLILITPIIPIILFIYTNYRLAVAFSLIILNFFTVWAFINSFLTRETFKEKLGKSIRWYYVTATLFLGFIPISIFVYIQNYTFGLYNADNILIIVLNYAVTISTTILLIILLIHLEQSILNREKFELKDKYSHDLGNTIQAIHSIIDLLDLKKDIDEEELKNLKELLKEKLNEAGITITEIRDL